MKTVLGFCLIFCALIYQCVATPEIQNIFQQNRPQRQLIRCTINNKQQATVLGSLVYDQFEDNHFSFTAAKKLADVKKDEKIEDFDIWSNSRLDPGQPTDIVIPSRKRDIITNTLKELAGISCFVRIQNVDSFIELHSKIEVSSAISPEEPIEDYFKKYHAFDDLIARAQYVAKKNRNVAKWIDSIGVTHENRSIPAVHVTDPSSSAQKRKIWWSGGIHAREWISSHVVSYITEKLITTYSSKEDNDETKIVNKALRNFEFVIAPHINPDGYEFSRTNSRMWRKNRRKNSDGSYGVDLNRNFDIKWGKGGSSSSPRSETYRGPSAASEPETKACQNYISSLDDASLGNSGGWILGIDFHSYSQLLMRPYGFSMDDHPLEPRNKKIGDAMRDAIKQTTKQKYVSQKSAGLYPVTGGFDDWLTMHGQPEPGTFQDDNTWDNMMIGFTIELRDRGWYGFLLPEKYILPTCQELWAAMVAMMKELLAEQLNN